MFRWHNILSDGCDDISDFKRSARLKIVTENVMKSVREKMSENYKRIQNKRVFESQTDSRSLEIEGISLSINILTVGRETQKMCTCIWRLF